MLKKLMYISFFLLFAASAAAQESYVIDSVCIGASRTYRIDGEKGSTYEWHLKDMLGNETTLTNPSGTPFTEINSPGDTIWGSEIDILWNTVDQFILSTYHFSVHGCDTLEHGYVRVFDLPAVDAGADQTVCTNEIITLSTADAWNYSSLLWTTAGDGTFDFYDRLHPTYYPGHQDSIAGSMELTLTANGMALNGTCTPVTDNVTILFGGPKPEMAFTNLLCYNDNAGTIKANVSGGFAPYAYSWTGPNGYSSALDSIYGLAAGKYILTVTDDAGCMGTDSIEITEPARLELTATKENDDSEPALTGSIDLAVTGGTAPYSFAWTGPNGFTSADEDINNLGAGEYTVVITDANGCTRSDTYIIYTEQTTNILTCPPDLDVYQCLSEVHPVFSYFKEFTDAGGSVYSSCGTDTTTFTGIEISRDGICPTYITRQYSVWDSCGTELTCLRGIRVNDNTAPVIVQTPGDIAVECYNDIPEPYQNYSQFSAAGGTVTDNCNVNMVYLGQSTPLGAGCPKTFLRTYRFEDDCGNYADYLQRVVMIDTQVPVITRVPNDTTTICARSTLDSYADFVRFGGIVTDNCGIDTATFHLVDQFDSGESICPKTITNTYYMADYCGNAVEFTHIVYVSDPEAPVMTSPPTDTLAADETLTDGFDNYTEFIMAGGWATDNCAVNPSSFRLISVDSTMQECLDIYNYIYEIADFCGNTDTAKHTIVKFDDEPPSMYMWPQVLTVTCTDDVPPVFETLDDFLAAEGAVNDVMIDESSFRMISEIDTGFACPRNIIRTYQIKDMCGNASQWTHTITISDEIPPVIVSLPGDITVECYDDIPGPYQNYSQFAVAGGTVTDNCNVNLVYLGQSTPLGAGCPKTYIRTYRFEDDCGNYVEYRQRVILNDTQLPEIVRVPNDTTTICARSTLNSYADFVRFGGIATDNCAIDTNTFRLVDQFDSGELICPKTITNVYHLADYCGNAVEFTHTVLVSDTEAPVMTGPPTDTLAAEIPLPDGSGDYMEFVAAGGLATDNCAVNPASFRLVSIDSSMQTCLNVYNYIYEIADFCGNTDTAKYTIVKFDGEPPSMYMWPQMITVACPEDVPPEFETLDDFLAAGGAVNDVMIDESSFRMISEIDTSSTCPKNIVRTYQIKDWCGNATQWIHTITISDETPPQIQCPPGIKLECAVSLPPVYTSLDEFLAAGGSVSDNCAIDSSSFALLTADTVRSNNSTDVIRWYGIRDYCGNLGYCSQALGINDTIPPDAVCNNITVYLDENGSLVLSDIEMSAISAGSSDNCTLPEDLKISTNIRGFDCTWVGDVKLVNITVEDLAGNQSTCAANVLIKDTVPPTALCRDTVVYLDENGTARVKINMIDNHSFDNCEIDTMYISQNTFTCEDSGDNLVTLTVTDKEANIAECTANVTVIDQVAPTVSCKDITVQLDYNAYYKLSYNEILANAFDECGIDSFFVSHAEFGCDDIGVNTVKLTAVDYYGNEGTCTAMVTIFGNTPPMAQNDTVYVAKNTSVEIDVAANDYDVKSNIVSSSVSTAMTPKRGIADVNPETGIITYTPNRNFVGQDAMLYSICDDGIPCEPMCTNAAVIIFVLDQNLPPIAVNDTFSVTCYMLTENMMYNDHDPDSYIFYADTIPVQEPENGSLIIQPNGTFTYLPETNFFGVDSFIYRICDIGIPSLCDEATVYINVLQDSDCDGVADWDDIDDDNDGILDVDEGDRSIDTDGDGIPDSLDIDSDNDGIPDNIEWQTENGYILPTGKDSNNNGWDDAYDTDSGGTYYKPTDTDSNGGPDYLDIDSDGDGVWDYIEGHDINADGIPDVVRLYMDSDNDGLDDAYDIFDDNSGQPSSPDNETGSNAPLQDFDLDGIRDWRDVNDDDDEFPTIDEDWNNDGDYSNDDMDQDGHPDYLDIDHDCELFIPDGFSPNGDGVHDFFQIFCMSRYPDAKMMIFNRSGNKLFEKEHYGNLDFWGSDEQAWWWGNSENSWTIRQKSLPAGNYVFILKLGNGETRTGTVMISY